MDRDLWHYRRQGSRPPPEKELQKSKRLSEEALQIAVKRRDTKSKEEKERYTHLNVESQRIARRDKKAFLNDQCKETEDNNRMGKTRDRFKKIRATKGTFHAKVGTIKDRLGMALTEAVHKNYTKKIFITQDNHDGVITHLEPDILKC